MNQRSEAFNDNSLAVRRSAEELRQQIEAHCRLVTTQYAEGGDVESGVCACRCNDGECPHCKRFKALMLEAIAALDGTRKAFKSKQLEHLRKKLTRALL